MMPGLLFLGFGGDGALTDADVALTTQCYDVNNFCSMIDCSWDKQDMRRLPTQLEAVQLRFACI